MTVNASGAHSFASKPAARNADLKSPNSAGHTPSKLPHKNKSFPRNNEAKYSHFITLRLPRPTPPSVPPTPQWLSRSTWQIVYSTPPIWKDKRNVTITYTIIPPVDGKPQQRATKNGRLGRIPRARRRQTQERQRRQ